MHGYKVWPGVPAGSVAIVSGLFWSPRGDLVVAGVGGKAYLWDVSDPRHPSEPRSVGIEQDGVLENFGFTPDGGGLVVVSAGPRISLVDIATGRTVWSRAIHDASDIGQFAVAPNGTTIAYDTGDDSGGHVTLLDAATGKITASLAKPTSGGVGYLNHGEWLVVTSDDPDPQAQLYDAATLTPLGVPMPTVDVDQGPVGVDPAGTRFAERVSGDFHQPKSWDPYLWNTDPASWVRIACSIAGRNLTEAEWRQYLPDRPYSRTCAQLPGPA